MRIELYSATFESKALLLHRTAKVAGLVLLGLDNIFLNSEVDIYACNDFLIY